MTEFKVGDKVRKNKRAIDEGLICSSCVVNNVPQICKVLEVRNEDEKVYVECPDRHKENMKFESCELVTPKTLKTPTHLVIWDEPSRDPHQFFTNDKKANDFIKELIEKNNVVKDSIVLVEIKTAKRIQIIKSLKPKEYKI